MFAFVPICAVKVYVIVFQEMYHVVQQKKGVVT